MNSILSPHYSLLANYTEPSFYKWQSEAVLVIQQNVQSKPLNIFIDTVDQLSNGVYYPIFALIIMVLFDLLQGYQLMVLLAFNVFVSLNIKYWARGGRPFWTNEKVIPRECHVGSFGFPSGHTQAPMVLLVFFCFYICHFYLKSKRFRLVKTSLNLMAAYLLFMFGFARIYNGVHYFHDVIAGYVFGGLIVAFHWLVLLPLIVRPLGAYSKGGSRWRVLVPISIIMVCGAIAAAMCMMSVTLPEKLLGFPDENWKIISSMKCKEPINAFHGYQDDYFKLMGVLIGTSIGAVLLNRAYPVYTGGQSNLRKISRMIMECILLIPVAGGYYLQSLIIPNSFRTSIAGMVVDYILGILMGFYFLMTFVILFKLNFATLNRRYWNTAIAGKFSDRVLRKDEEWGEKTPIIIITNSSEA